MKRVLPLYCGFLLLVLTSGCTESQQPAATPETVAAGAITEPDTQLYELRVYHAAAGKLGALERRFRDHTVALFEKHGFTNVGYWTPVDNADSLLMYVVAYPDTAARRASWQAFLNDPDWQAAYEASIADGKLVDLIESTLMQATDYSPPVGGEGTDHTFELRTYHAMPGKLADLHARFRDHTVALFTRHGMAHVGYWGLLDPERADNTLIYVLAHNSTDAAKASWDAFRADPDWVAAKEASEVNGPLVEAIASVFMTPTDFSPAQ